MKFLKDQMKKYDVLIVGGGFAGIYAAWRLAKSGCSVGLVEASPKIGGILNSTYWKKYWLDNGTHNFDFRTRLAQEFFSDILGDNIQIWEKPNWASTTDKTWTHGFEMPDYGNDDRSFSKQALADLEALSKKEKIYIKSEYYLKDYLDSHGPTLSSRNISLVKKFIGSDPKNLSSEARQALSIFDRPKLGTDAEMVSLKSSGKFWDDRLGVTLFSGEDRFLGDNLSTKYCYPKLKGLKGFCISAHQRLKELGVEILVNHSVDDIIEKESSFTILANGSKLNSRHVFWSLPEITLNKILNTGVDFSQGAIPVGTCFFAFEVFEKIIQGPDYLNDFSQKRISFRYNKMGVYSGQTQSNGKTVIMVEIPTHPSNIKKNLSNEMTQIVWNNICDVGFVSADALPIDSTAWGLPVAYTMPTVDWNETYNRSNEIISTRLPNLKGIASGYRGRSSFPSYYDKNLHNQLRA